MIKSKNKGFTYIELSLAMAIIAFIVLAFAQLFLSTSVSVSGMEFQTLAYNFAGDKMEEIKNRNFADIVSETDSPNLSGKSFNRIVTVSELVTANLKRVDIKVEWNEGNESIEISSLIANKE